MKKTFVSLLFTILIFAVGTLSAATINCTPTPPMTIATVGNLFTTPPTSSPTITCGPLVFSNFQAVSAASGTPLGLPFDYISPGTYNSTTGTVSVNFNPNFSVPSTGLEDIHLYFDVTATSGHIIGVDGSIAGTNSHYTEYVCAGAGGYSGAGGCTGSPLTNFTVFSGQTQGVLSIASSTSVGIYKDIQALGPGALTGLGQTFEVTPSTPTVPEPETLAMFGTAVLGIFGLARRKRNL